MLLVPRAPVLAIAAAVLALSSVAHAQTPDHVVLGIGVVSMPAYQGADSYRTLPIPVIDVIRGPFFANLRNGIGVNVVESRTVTLGGSVAIMPGYRGRDTPNGIGNLPVGAGGRLFATVRAGGIVATLGGTQGFAGSTEGFIADASLSYPIVAAPRLIVMPSVATSWANAKHNDRYFGVSFAQSGASGLPEFQPGKGFKDVSATVTAIYRMTDRLNLNASVGATSLLSDVKNSPIVYHKVRPTGMLALSFSFD